MYHYHECGCEVRGGCELPETQSADARTPAQRTHDELRKIMNSFAHPDALTGVFSNHERLQAAQKHQTEAQRHLAHILDLLNAES